MGPRRVSFGSHSLVKEFTIDSNIAERDTVISYTPIIDDESSYSDSFSYSDSELSEEDSMIDHSEPVKDNGNLGNDHGNDHGNGHGNTNGNTNGNHGIPPIPEERIRKGDVETTRDISLIVSPRIRRSEELTESDIASMVRKSNEGERRKSSPNEDEKRDLSLTREISSPTRERQLSLNGRVNRYLAD